jgi:hypothetical protein
MLTKLNRFILTSLKGCNIDLPEQDVTFVSACNNDAIGVDVD